MMILISLCGYVCYDLLCTVLLCLRLDVGRFRLLVVYFVCCVVLVFA